MDKLSYNTIKVTPEYLYEMRRIIRFEREKKWKDIAPEWVRILLDHIAELEQDDDKLQTLA